jgi:hypothetical protein
MSLSLEGGLDTGVQTKHRMAHSSLWGQTEEISNSVHKYKTMNVH